MKKDIPILNKNKEKQLIKQKQELFLKIFCGIEPNLLINSKIKKFIEKINLSNYAFINKIVDDSRKIIKENSNCSFLNPKNCKAVYQSGNVFTFAFEEEAKFRTIITNRVESRNNSVPGIDLPLRVPFPKSLFLISLRKNKDGFTYARGSVHALKSNFNLNSVLYDAKIPHALHQGSICLGTAHLNRNFQNPQEAIDAFFKSFFGSVFHYDVSMTVNEKRINSYEAWSKLSLEEIGKVKRQSQGNVEKLASSIGGRQLEDAVARLIYSNLNKAFTEMLEVEDLRKSFEEIFKSISKTVQ
ncbi:MAG: hypothetical protein EKK64_00575 [Neisseriaceae bacterium]|nr:MAG: hypothetical protein EKK64_00575 [Neisseriaceae bacterium]